MPDSFASDLSYRVLQQAHREHGGLAPPPFHQPQGRPNPVLAARRLVELLNGLGEHEPLVCENNDELVPHGR